MLKKAKRALKRLIGEDGLETVEYAIITGLIVAATIVVIASIGAWVLATFQGVETALGAGGP